MLVNSIYDSAPRAFNPQVPYRRTLSAQGSLSGQACRMPSGTDAFLQTLATMNEAAHGFEVEPAAAAKAPRVASEFLAELRRLAAE